MVENDKKCCKIIKNILIPLVGPPFTDPLAVKLLDNQQYIQTERGFIPRGFIDVSEQGLETFLPHPEKIVFYDNFKAFFYCFRPCKCMHKHAFAGQNTQQLYYFPLLGNYFLFSSFERRAALRNKASNYSSLTFKTKLKTNQ